ncbi:hypothetical protein BZG36_02897 [Bifiguratus adelaidae]|uniref:F-box domain-containing protein n=1 Tax=Bifiguratus adelaidae TaxID=1938954 RepID=A0A261Y253_9FUNG|nr:hypothetical protein BZG36_02897 [Bifiguratus adelaidae]
MVRKAKYARRQSASVPPKYDLTERLSDEIVLHIFGYLSAADLNTCARVTLRWFWLANDSHLWKKLYLSRFQTPLTVQETISRPNRAYERIDTGMDVQERPQKRRKVVDANEVAANNLPLSDIRQSNSDADAIVPMRLRSLPSEPGRRWKTWYKISHRWQTVPVYGGGWSVGVQQFYFTKRHIGVTQYTILSNQANYSPPFHPISRRRRISPLISYAPITALAYSSPYITTAHTDNTVQIYRIIDDHSPYDDERQHHRLRIVHERTLSGVASRVGSLAIDSRSGRVVSGDRWGIKIWEINEDADDVIPNDTQVLEDYSFWDDDHSMLDNERKDRLDSRITLDNHISTIKSKKERGIFLVDLHDAMLDPVTGYNSGSGSGGMQGGITSVSFDDNRIIGVVSGPTEDKGVDWWSEVKVWKFASD